MKVKNYLSALNKLTCLLYLRFAGSTFSSLNKLEKLSSIFEDLVSIQNNTYLFLGRFQDDTPAMYQKIIDLNWAFITHGFSDLSEQGIAEALQQKSNDDGRKLREKLDANMSAEQRQFHQKSEELVKRHLDKKN